LPWFSGFGDLGQQQQTTEWETAVSPTAAGVLSSWKGIKRQQENDKKTGHDKFCHARVKKCFFRCLNPSRLSRDKALIVR
jgi:hypothetical protein